MNIDLSNLTPTLEGILISGDDVVYNLDKWDSKESSILFITGYSGSGKTTTSKELATKYGVELLETDEWMVDADYDDQVSELFKYITEIRRSGKRRAIVEGLILMDIFVYNEIAEEFFLDSPIIVKNTSFVKSTLRAASRDSDSESRKWSEQLRERLRVNKAFHKDFERFLKHVKTRAADQKVYDLYLGQVKQLFRDKYKFNIDYMKVGITNAPINTDGSLSRKIKPIERAGNWTQFQKIYLADREHLINVLKHYNVKTPLNEFIVHMLSHELAHEVWNSIASEDAKKKILQNAENTQFTTAYLKVVPKEKLPTETFCEYIAESIVEEFEFK